VSFLRFLATARFGQPAKPLSRRWFVDFVASARTGLPFDIRGVSSYTSEDTPAEQQYLSYKKTVLTAFQDVENALVSYRQEKERYAALSGTGAATKECGEVAMPPRRRLGTVARAH
jgi:hypothetical protein